MAKHNWLGIHDILYHIISHISEAPVKTYFRPLLHNHSHSHSHMICIIGLRSFCFNYLCQIRDVFAKIEYLCYPTVCQLRLSEVFESFPNFVSFWTMHFGLYFRNNRLPSFLLMS